jgi:hypothetical protein
MRVGVDRNSIEFRLGRAELILLSICIAIVAVLFIFAGWEIAVAAMGMGLVGAGLIDGVQRIA